VVLLRRSLPLGAMALRLPPVRSLVTTADRLVRDALFDDPSAPSEEGGPR